MHQQGAVFRSDIFHLTQTENGSLCMMEDACMAETAVGNLVGSNPTPLKFLSVSICSLFLSFSFFFFFARGKVSG